MRHKNPTAERVRALTLQALKEANIEEHGAQHVRSSKSKKTIIYWQSVGNRIELVIDHEEFDFGALHCSFSILPISYLVAEFFLEDAAAIGALLSVFEYLQGMLSDLLEYIAEGLQAKRAHLSYPTAPQHEKQGLKFISSILDPRLSRWDLRFLQRSKQFRGERTVERRGGSHPSIEISDELLANLSRNYPPLLKHWQTIKKLRNGKVRNWRQYAKTEADTPDDLLDRLDGKLPAEAKSGGEAYLNIPSALAIEHAARRVGIRANLYSLSNLSKLRQRGDEILGQSKPST